jgi:hypothetical protein
MARKMMTVTGLRLAEIRAGLAVLKEKRLPTADAEGLVASMWMLFKPAFDTYDDIVKKLQKEQREAEELENEDDKKQAHLDVQTKADALQVMPFEVPSPKTKLQAQHMPKTHKGRDGDDNPRGNAAVIIALAPEVYQIDGTNEDRDDTPDTPEGDE